jgi:hypothetical protein
MRTGTNNDMWAEYIMIGGGTTAAAISWLALAFAESFGTLEISVIEKLGGAGVAALLAFYFLKYLVNRNKELDAKISEQSAKLEAHHRERYEQLDRQHREMIEVLKSKE